MPFTAKPPTGISTISAGWKTTSNRSSDNSNSGASGAWLFVTSVLAGASSIGIIAAGATSPVWGPPLIIVGTIGAGVALGYVLVTPIIAFGGSGAALSSLDASKPLLSAGGMLSGMAGGIAFGPDGMMPTARFGDLAQTVMTFKMPSAIDIGRMGRFVSKAYQVYELGNALYNIPPAASFFIGKSIRDSARSGHASSSSSKSSYSLISPSATEDNYHLIDFTAAYGSDGSTPGGGLGPVSNSPQFPQQSPRGEGGEGGEDGAGGGGGGFSSSNHPTFRDAYGPI